MPMPIVLLGCTPLEPLDLPPPNMRLGDLTFGWPEKETTNEHLLTSASRGMDKRAEVSQSPWLSELTTGCGTIGAVARARQWTM
jgi:hypothetical protein